MGAVVLPLTHAWSEPKDRHIVGLGVVGVDCLRLVVGRFEINFFEPSPDCQLLELGDVAFIRRFVWDSQTSDKQCSMGVKTNENGFARLQVFTLMHQYQFSETNNHWECTRKSVYFH